MGITNAMNLLDNMDGLRRSRHDSRRLTSTLLAAMSVISRQRVAAALAGACAGFLVYNWNPARIFMGDTGSLFIGFLLAAVAIKLRFPSNSVTVTWMIPLLVMGLFIFDTGLVFISRLRRGKNPLTTPGKDHLSHRLARLGSRREAVLICYLVAGALGLVGVFVTQATLSEAIVSASAVAVIALFSIWQLEFRNGGIREPEPLSESVRSTS